jgi:hypothetical protein
VAGSVGGEGRASTKVGEFPMLDPQKTAILLNFEVLLSGFHFVLSAATALTTVVLIIVKLLASICRSRWIIEGTLVTVR